jgi:hypothetical protein
MSSVQVGIAMTIFGVTGVIAQLWFYPWFAAKHGTMWSLRYSILPCPVTYGGAGLLTLFPFPWIGISTLLVLSTITRTMSLPSCIILITHGAPKDMLGFSQGAAQSAASLSRTLGPVVSGFIFTRLAHNTWFLLAGFALIGVFQSFTFRDEEED